MNYARNLKYMVVQLHASDRIFHERRFWMGAKQDKRLKGYFVSLESDPSVTKFVSFEDLYNGLKSGETRVDSDYHSDVQSLLRRLYGDKRLRDFKDEFVQLARHKEQVIFRYEGHVAEFGKPTREQLTQLLIEWNNEVVIQRAKLGKVKAKNSQRAVKATVFKHPNARTFLSYYDEYLTAGRDIRILIPRHRGPGKHHRLHKVDPESFALWTQVAYGYADLNKPTKKQLLEECIGIILKENEGRESEGRTDLLKKPGRKQFENIINAMDKFQVMIGREGLTKAMAHFRGQHSGFDVERPGQRIEFDSYLLEMQTWLMIWDLWDKLDKRTQEELKPVRIYLNMARDAYTGYTCACTWSHSENSEAIVNTLDMALSDKTNIARYVGAETSWPGGVRYGEGYADNGPGYIADYTHDAFRAARVSLSHPPAGQPWHRGFVEGMLGVISRTLMTYFDGRTFKNVVEKGNYKSEERATLTVDEAVCLILRAILDYYHHQINPRTKKSPHDAWLDFLEETGAEWGADIEMRISVFGTEDKRVIHADGIYKWGVRYNSDDLQTLRKFKGSEKVKIRWLRADMRWISVEGEDGHWFLVENRSRMKEQVTVDEWLHVRRELENQAKDAQEPMLPRMYKALADISSSVEEARVRVQISPSTLSAQDFANAERDLFQEDEAFPCNDVEEFDVVAAPIPRNPLREGGVVMTRPDRKRVPILPTTPKIKSKKEQKNDEAGYN